VHYIVVLGSGHASGFEIGVVVPTYKLFVFASGVLTHEGSTKMHTELIAGRPGAGIAALCQRY
jgi:hypothetical protein